MHKVIIAANIDINLDGFSCKRWALASLFFVEKDLDLECYVY